MQRALEQIQKMFGPKALAVTLGGVAAYMAIMKFLAGRKRWPMKALPAPEAPVKDEERLRVVIVGGGVGGTFAAMWLREMLGDRLDLKIIHSGTIGGRCRTIAVPNDGAADSSTHSYECGASIISEMNEYILDVMKTNNLKQQEGVFTPMGIWNGSQIIFQEAFYKSSKLSSIVSSFRLISRYGLSNLLGMKRTLKTKPGLPDFSRLYKALQEGSTYKTPRDLLLALSRGGGEGSYELSQESSKVAFSKLGVSEKITNELIEAGMRSNYGGQTLDQLHAIVGLISVFGGLASTCFRIKGGNFQIAEHALATAKATVIEGTARLVKLQTDASTADQPGTTSWFAWGTGTTTPREPPASGSKGKYEVVYDDSKCEYMEGGQTPGPGTKKKTLDADVVLIAHHLAAGTLKFEGVQAPEAGGLQRCCTHFLRGSLKASAFGLPSNEPVPAQILTTGGETPFNSIGLQAPVDATKQEVMEILAQIREGGKGTFKVFAPKQLSEDELSQFFDIVPGTLRVADWHAYPSYTVPPKFPPFVLADGLVYLNAVETIGSAMEMCAVAARNAVNLVREWHPQGLR